MGLMYFAPAWHNAGLMHGGRGTARAVPQDKAEAVRWFRLAAEQGLANAQYNLGLMYEYGHGVPQDYAEAVRWYRLAAEQGITSAQYNLGVMYENGKGVPQDFVYAHLWWNLIAANGDKTAAKNRDTVAQQMSAAQIAEAQRLARECVAKNYKGC
jgi:uncharacterized protein